MFPKKIYEHITSSSTGMILFLFSLSLIIRLIFIIPIIIFDVPLVTDEITYFERAVGYEKIFSDLFHGNIPATSSSAVIHSYGGGLWPPLQPFILGLGYFIFGKHIVVGRLLMMVISAMTTPFIYLLASKLTTKKAAIIAASIHILYPSFIAYSHYLYSETTYIFLLVAAVYLSVLIPDTMYNRKKIKYAIFSGILLGLCGLTRPAALPFLFVIPICLFFYIREIKLKVFLPVLLLFSWLIILLPWQTLLEIKHDNPGILSAITGWYLHLGNNPWIPDGYGSSWQHDSRGPMLEAARTYAKTHFISIDKAQRILALQEIKQNYTTFFIRGFYKIRMLWSSELTILQSIFNTVYPPMSSALVIFIWSFSLISYILILFFSICGFLGDSQFLKKTLIITLLISGISTSFVTFGISRYHLPFVALLLPIAGHGAVNFNQNISLIRRIIIAIITLLFCFSVYTSLPLIISTYLRPSIYYCGIINKADKLLGSDSTCTDRILLKNNSGSIDHINIKSLKNNYLLQPTPLDPWWITPRTQNYQWHTTTESNILSLTFYSKNNSPPLKILLSSGKSGESAIIQPIQKAAWGKWLPSGVSGIDYMWLAGGWGVRQTYPDDKLFNFEFTTDFIL